MPTFKRQLQQPLPAKGENTAIIIGADQETTKKGTVRLRVPLHFSDGKIFTTTVPFLEEYNFVEELALSAGLQFPDEGDPQISCDDLERLQVYFGIEHKEGKDGRVYANVRFHQKAYAIQQNPALANVKFPQARKPGKLRGVIPLDDDIENGSSDNDHFDEDDRPMTGHPEAEQLRNLLEGDGKSRQPHNHPF
jgi:hypothetical protein